MTHRIILYLQRDRTCLHIASALGYCDIIQLLIMFGADLNCKDHKSNTSLCLTVAGNHILAVELLI